MFLSWLVAGFGSQWFWLVLVDLTMDGDRLAAVACVWRGFVLDCGCGCGCWG